MTFKKHGALIGAVHKQLIHTGAMSVEIGKWLVWLFELRSVGDYGEIAHVDEGQARLALSRAQDLFDAFVELLRNASQGS